MKVAFSTTGRCVGDAAASRRAATVVQTRSIVPRRPVAPDVIASSGRKAAGLAPCWQPLHPQHLRVYQASGTGPDMPNGTKAEVFSKTRTGKLITSLKPLAAAHPHSATTLLSWVEDLAKQVESDLADDGDLDCVEVLSQMAQVRGCVLGADHPRTLDTRRRLAHVKQHTIDDDCSSLMESYETLLDLLNAHVRVLGPNHPYVLECMLLLAQSAEGELLERKDVLTNALELSTRIHGAGHENTKRVTKKLWWLQREIEEVRIKA